MLILREEKGLRIVNNNKYLMPFGIPRNFITYFYTQLFLGIPSETRNPIEIGLCVYFQ